MTIASTAAGLDAARQLIDIPAIATPTPRRPGPPR